MTIDMEWIKARTEPRESEEGEAPCLVWTRSATNGGRDPRHYENQSSKSTRRSVWEAFNGGPVPEGVYVANSCGCSLCIQPVHLILRTVSETRQMQRRLAHTNFRRAMTASTTRGTPIADVRAGLESGETDEELAKRLGVSPKTVAGWRRGDRLALRVGDPTNPFAQLMR